MRLFDRGISTIDFGPRRDAQKAKANISHLVYRRRVAYGRSVTVRVCRTVNPVAHVPPWMREPMAVRAAVYHPTSTHCIEVETYGVATSLSKKHPGNNKPKAGDDKILQAFMNGEEALLVLVQS